MSKKKKQKRKSPSANIKKLTEENKKLKLEVKLLKSKLEDKESEEHFHKRSDATVAKFENQAQKSKLFSRRTFFGYVYHTAKATSVFKIYKRIINTVRRYTFITTSIKIASFIFAFLETSAVFVIAASAFAISLPFTILFSYLAFLFSHMNAKKRTEQLMERMKSKKIYVFFPPKSLALSESSFLCGFVRDIASKEDSFCIIVSPYIFKSKGISQEKGAFVNVRDERSKNNNIVIVRRNYFFSIKKNIFKRKGHVADVCEIY